jgi:hypothetical protein
MTSIVFILLALLSAVGVIKWIFSFITSVQGNLWWPVVLSAVEFIGAALVGIIAGTDAWSGWGIFLAVLGYVHLGLREIVAWVQIVVAWIKKRNPLGR